mgnify:CR=1 FL=1
MAAMAAFLSVPTVAMAITENELDCEQQAKRLTGCCGDRFRPGVTPEGESLERIICFDLPEGCEGDDFDPRTAPEVIQCLEDLSCDEVKQLGLCDEPEACNARRV